MSPRVALLDPPVALRFDIGSTMGISILGLGLLNLPLIVAQWLGLLAMRRRSKGGAWRCMMAGTLLSTLGWLLALIMMVMMTLLSGAFRAPEWIGLWMMLTGSSQALGSLVFAVGFAIHGAGLKREADRVTELEMIIAAQNEQLARHQG